MTRKKLLEKLRSVIHINGHIFGISVGNGMTTEYALEGNVDLLLTMNAGRFRQMGQSAFNAFMGYSNTNQLVLDFATKEVFPLAKDAPIICGIFMQDPCIHLYDYIKKIKEYGFSGIINYPTVSCIDGDFRNALENNNLGFEKEVEGIRIAHFLDLFTIAYASNLDQAIQMVSAGADAICLHLGITGGGLCGANKVISLENAIQITNTIFNKIDEINPDVIKLVCSGPIQTPIDAHTLYQNTKCQGFLAGSAIERLPVERTMLNTIKAFKSPGDFNEENIISKVLNGAGRDVDYAQFMIEYIEKNYSKPIRMKELSYITHVSAPRLSVLFKEKTNMSFTQYLIDYRMNIACNYLRNSNKQMKEVSILVGYEDYSQFAKCLRKNIR